MKVGYVYHPVYLKHDTGEHVENAGRLEAIISYLQETGLDQQLAPVSPRPATIDDVTDFFVGRTLDLLGLPNTLYPRWGEGP